MFEGLLLPWQQIYHFAFYSISEQLLKFLANFTLLEYVESQRSYGFLITEKLIFGFQILDLKVHFSASLTAHADNQNWRKELHSFLLNYRASPHSATKIPPAEALYNRSIHTKLPEPITKPLNTEQHKKLKVADEKVKRKMKEYHDKRTNAKEWTFNIGDTVLVKQQRTNELSTRCNPNIYTVKHVKATIITATSGIHKVLPSKLDWFLSTIRVLSTGGGRRGGSFPPETSQLPPPKVLLKKKLQLFQIKIFFNDDFKESVKVTNVQKCDFSQS